MAAPSVFNKPLRTQQMLMNGKSYLIPILAAVQSCRIDLRSTRILVNLKPSEYYYVFVSSKAGISEVFEGHQGPVTGIDCHKVPGQIDFSPYFITSSFDWTIKLWSIKVSIYEPVCEKTNNLVSDQVRHKPGCTVIEDG